MILNLTIKFSDLTATTTDSNQRMKMKKKCFQIHQQIRTSFDSWRISMTTKISTITISRSRSKISSILSSQQCQNNNSKQTFKSADEKEFNNWKSLSASSISLITTIFSIPKNSSNNRQQQDHQPEIVFDQMIVS